MTDAQTKKYCNRGTALEWSGGKQMVERELGLKQVLLALNLTLKS